VLKGGAALAASAALARVAHADTRVFAPKPGAWRQFEVTTRVEIVRPQGRVQVWLPAPSGNEGNWFAAKKTVWSTNAAASSLRRDPRQGAAFIHAEWGDGQPTATIESSSVVAMQDRAVDLTQPRDIRPLSDAERRRYTAPSGLIPTDGIVKRYSDQIVAGATADIDKARRIYEWVVDNCHRDAATRGCGNGDIVAMLRSGNLGGKCADLNALFVGLARAAGLPARDLYGIRVAPSRFGYKSLGANSADVTKAQHCRAEVHLAQHGWVPMDPADVRKVVLEEPPTNLALDNPAVVAARKTLFGSWEGNWLAYNTAHDVRLTGAEGPAVDFLMYPQAEIAGLRLDCLDPEAFKYTITARELSI
jgi:transglutaminase-like putative cysteine protease